MPSAAVWPLFLPSLLALILSEEGDIFCAARWGVLPSWSTTHCRSPATSATKRAVSMGTKSKKFPLFLPK